jgi:hypothetical protein
MFQCQRSKAHLCTRSGAADAEMRFLSTAVHAVCGDVKATQLLHAKPLHWHRGLQVDTALVQHQQNPVYKQFSMSVHLFMYLFVC